jgi:hypothetical protein
MMRKALTNVHFHFAYGFDTQTLATTFDSLVRVSRRAANNHYASIHGTRSSVQAGCIVQEAITPEGHIPQVFIQPPKLMLA